MHQADMQIFHDISAMSSRTILMVAGCCRWHRTFFIFSKPYFDLAVVPGPIHPIQGSVQCAPAENPLTISKDHNNLFIFAVSGAGSHQVSRVPRCSKY